MEYYTIQNNSILIADNEQALLRFYDDVFELPEDYEQGKYIIGDNDIEIDVPDYETAIDDEGNEYQNQTGSHKETVTVKTLVLNPNYEKEQEEKEKERIAKLSLTKREVFLALYRSKGLTPETVRNQITDTEALIEFDYATEYYRFNPLIDSIGTMLGFSSDDLDYLFENKEFRTNE